MLTMLMGRRNLGRSDCVTSSTHSRGLGLLALDPAMGRYADVSETSFEVGLFRPNKKGAGEGAL